MAIKGEFWFEDMDVDAPGYTMLECEYSLSQEVNKSNGIPISGIEASQIVVTVVTPSKGNLLYEWMMAEFGFKSGVILLKTSAKSSKYSRRYVLFENAKCVGLYDYFNYHSSSMMTTRITIQPGRIAFIDIDSFEKRENAIGYDFRHKRKSILNYDTVVSRMSKERKEADLDYINSWDV